MTGSARAQGTGRLRLAAVIFDMDGVITRTAGLHAAAWKELFDDFLRQRAARTGDAFAPFDERSDYLAHVDGRPRIEGARNFLAARGITLPEGGPGDEPGADTVQGLAARKDALFERRLRAEGAALYDSTIALIRELRARGVKTGVVTSSRHGREVLAIAGVADLFDARIDGVDAAERGLAGKPAPDIFVACARELGVEPARCAAVEDAIPGVEAAQRGGFGLVIGLDRGGNRAALARHGAHVVLDDLADITLQEMERRLREAAPKADADRPARAWMIEQEGYDAAREHEMESIFTVGNGRLGVRGALDSPLSGSQGDLFVAGIYDRKHAGRPYSEHEFMDVGRGDYPYSELVSFPFPFRVRLRADGEALDLASGSWHANRRVLDLRRALLEAEQAYETKSGARIVVRTRRCASIADPHLLLQELAVRVVDAAVDLEIDVSLEDPDLARAHPHLVPRPAGAAARLEAYRYETIASGFEIGIVSRAALAGAGGGEGARWRARTAAGETLLVRRAVAVHTSRDAADPCAAAQARVGALEWDRFEQLIAEHGARWSAFWERADVTIPDAPEVEQALRFHAYHLRIAADHDPGFSVGARALTGRAYEGHVFWDVEIFMLPFYLHACPDIARCLLEYRYRTLDGARARARELGFRGACYAWESTVDGADVTPSRLILKTSRREIPIYTGTEQVHVTADVAYGVWRYWEATHDAQFMREAGCEILFETARFWPSRATRRGARLHILGVTGPDEYHHTVDDNAYTNWMARVNLERAAWAARWLAREAPGEWEALAARCELGRAAPEEWEAAARDLHVPEPDARGVIEQFAGFFELEDYPLPRQERFKAPVSRLFDAEKINRLKLVKQADVLMLPHLFPEAFSPDVVAANYRYYEPLTDHGSSLSPSIHAAIAARLGLAEDAERYWRQSLWLDLSNAMGNSVLGVHPACMGGTWQALVFGFLGVRFTDRGPRTHPAAGARLPPGWRSVQLRLAWRGDVHEVRVERGAEPRQ